MPLDYDAMRRDLPKLRAGLTRAKNSGDPLKVLDAVEKAVNRFDEIGWPDAWSTFRAALDDAFWKFSRSDARYGDSLEEDEQIDKTIRRFHEVTDRFV